MPMTQRDMPHREGSARPVNHRRSFLIPGLLFGAWLGLVYAFCSQAINWAFLPEIPLEPPAGGVAGYLLLYAALGGLLGLVSAIPEHRWMGAGAGAAVAAVLMVGYALASSWGAETFSSTVVVTLLFALPLVAFMLPVAFILRLGLDAQAPDPSRPHLWARRYLILCGMTLTAAAAGSLALYSADVRAAMREQHGMVQQGLRAASADELPEPLRVVPNYLESADGPYHLAWSDRPETFFGPQPVGNELAQFIIITRFDNGFRLDCLYSPNRAVPTCTRNR